MRTQLFHFLSVSAAALALCCACVEEMEPSDILDGRQPLVFTAGQADMTLSTRAAADGAWDGDGTEFVAIKIGEEVKKYKVTSYDGALEPYDSDDTFYRTDTGDIEVTAWYPYSDELPTAPSIQIDQSTKEGREASNLMKATATAVFGSATTLAFSHQTALVRVSVTSEDGTSVTGATVKILGIKAYEDGGGSYSALLPPCSVNTNADLINIQKNSKTYKAKAPTDVTLEAGKSYVYNFSLKRSLVTTGGIEVTLSETVFDYTGNVLRPTVTVTYNGSELTENTDYTLSWSNSSSSAEGDYTVTVTGKGAYIGSVQKNYTIVKIPYVTFSASNSQTFTMTLPTDATAAAAIGTFEYSVGGGTWTTVISGMTAEEFGGTKGDLRLRGTGLKSDGTTESLFGTAYSDGTNKFSTISFGTTATVTASGDIRTLIAYKSYSTISTSKASFCNLFKNCTILTSAPDLPAINLKSYCYYRMFLGCKALKTAPATLPATTLTDHCYCQMFDGCESLETAPTLPATKLANYCYYGMFNDCKALTTAPDLSSITTLNASCCYGMFKRCTALVAAPKLPSAKPASECYAYMFYGCTSIKTAPDLNATTSASKCYLYMFYGCTSIKTAPAISATSLAANCCEGMFTNCTALTAAPDLSSVTTLGNKCCYEMFEGCTALTAATQLPSATTLASQCYSRMFHSCSSLKTVPETLPAKNLASNCYEQMFYNCSSLETSPILPATTLASKCYSWMFYGCKKLNSVTVKATTTADKAFDYWLNSVNSSGTVYKSKDLNLPANSASGIPSGWNCVNQVEYFYVEAVTAGATVKMTSAGSAPTIYLIYSKDGKKWYDFTVGSTSVDLQNKGDKVWFKAGSEAGATKTNSCLATGSSKYNKFSFTGEVNVGGDITTLLSSDGDVSSLPDHTFRLLFSGCTTLISAADLSLPATELGNYCYKNMFSDCTKLTSAPKGLPATTLGMECYLEMFKGCTNLTSAPELKATTLAGNCCAYMFKDCKALKTVPSSLPATTLVNCCYTGMFQGCTKLTSAPELPATTLAGQCYQYMFKGCTNLTSAPELKATTLAGNCYGEMFQGCTSLKSVTIKATTNSTSNNALSDWLPTRSSDDGGIIYYSDEATKTLLDKESAIPTGWTATKISN